MTGAGTHSGRYELTLYSGRSNVTNLARTALVVAAAVAVGLLVSRAAHAGCGDITHTGAAGTGFELVKTSFGTSGICIVNDQTTCSCDQMYSVYGLNFSAPSFTPGRTAVAFPGAGDPNTRTVNPESQSGNSYTITTYSLRDIGTWTYTYTAAYTDGVNIYTSLPATITFVIGNSSPQAHPSFSGTPRVGQTVTLDAHGSDPDHPGSALPHFNWSVSGPAGASGTLSDPHAATPTLHFTSKHDIGSWTVNVDVGDQEAEELHAPSFTITVPNQPPTITVSGATDIPATDHLQLQAGPDLDPDGEDVTFEWNLTAHPSSATPPSMNISGTTIDWVMGPTAIGDWTFDVAATDEHGATAHSTVTVHVHAVPPVIHISPTSITIYPPGSANIHFEDTQTVDAYGEDISMHGSYVWDLRQVPVTAGVPLGKYAATGPILDVATATSSAGTWKFRLTVTDQTGTTATADVKALVDADPIAHIVGPAVTGNLSLPLQLDGSASYDPDAPNTPPDYGHLHADPVDVSSSVLSYQWSVLDAPSVLGPANTGTVDDLFGVSGTSSMLDISAGKVPDGNWHFQLDVADEQGHHAAADQWVQVIDEGLPPIASIAPPVSNALTDLSGALLGGVHFDGSSSFDIDNLLSAPYSPGLGITNYAWSLSSAPPLCTSLPALASGPSATSVDLYTAGTVVPPECHGAYTVNLTVTDDDAPIHKTNTASAVAIVGNCPGNICIDYPTHGNHQNVTFSDQTDVVIYYHLNSALYALASYASGLRLQLSITPELDPIHPFYSDAWDVDLLPNNQGGVLAIHWHGYGGVGGHAKQRPEPGKYNIALQLVDPSGTLTADSASETTAVWIQTVGATIDPATDSFLSCDGIAATPPTDSLTVSYHPVSGTSGTPSYDEAVLHIYAASDHHEVFEKSYSGSPPPATLIWGGDLGGGTFLPAAAYLLAVELKSGGASLGTSADHPFWAYELTLKTTTPAPNPLPVMVNSDDDDRNNVPDLAQSPAAAGEDDLVSVNLSLKPSITGTLVLSSSVMPAPFRIWTAADKTTEIMLPHAYSLPADPLPATIFVEGTSAAVADFVATLTPTGASALLPSKLPLNLIELSTMAETDNNFANGPDVSTLFVRLGLWDRAFRLASDPFGTAGSLYNEEDDARITAAGNPENFVARDSRAFYLRIKDPARNTNPAVPEEIPLSAVEWFTVKADGTDDDHPPTNSSISLIETGPNTGVFLSGALMLVASKIDRDQPTNTGTALHPGIAAYDTANHRTRQVGNNMNPSVPDGASVLRYQPVTAGSSKLVLKTPLFQRQPEERKQVTIHFFNISDTTHAIAATPNATVTREMRQLSERLTVMGFRANTIFNVSTDVIDLPASSPINLNMVNGFTGGFGGLMPSADQSALIALVRGVDPAVPANADTIYMVVIRGFAMMSEIGESFADGWTVPAASRNFTFMAGMHANNDFTTAHEIVAHILCNQTLTAAEAAGTAPGWDPGGHYGGPAGRGDVQFNLCEAAPTTSTPPVITDSLRVWDDPIHLLQQIRRARTATRYLKAP